MPNYTEEDLQQALTAINSIKSKCEKALINLKPNSAQQTLLQRRIKAFHIAVDLMNGELLQLYNPPSA